MKFKQEHMAMGKIATIVIFFFLLGIALVGCGGGGGGGTTSNTTSSSSSTGGDPGTGTTTSEETSVSVRVVIPASVAHPDGNTKYVPFGTEKAYITLTSESGAHWDANANITDTSGAVGGGSAVISFTNIPGGLNTLAITVKTSGNVILAERTHAYFQQTNTHQDEGPIHMGVGIKADSVTPANDIYEPQNIDVLIGSDIYFQSLLTSRTHDCTLTDSVPSDNLLKTLAAIVPSAGPETPAVYDYVKYDCDTAGIYTYKNDDNSPKGVLCVYDAPTITTFWDSTSFGPGGAPEPDPNADRYVPDGDAQSVVFTMTGANFGATQTLAGGVVSLYKWDETNNNWTTKWGDSTSEITITSWTNSYVKGSFTMNAVDAGKYRFVITVHGYSDVSQSGDYLIKGGTGSVDVTVD